ncbi:MULTISPECIES: site-specific integrase [Vibrio]|uniref:integrase n=1 Tax=Vibrio TaxID=662 RepID=UPI000B5C4538|nr:MULTISPECIES: integrase [Vibrio]HBV78005.1 site-specific integrase [Vibrio sp.]
MAFIGNETRKTLDVKNNENISVIDIPNNKLIFRNDQRSCYFHRLGYQGCPKVKIGSNGQSFRLQANEQLVDMNRWELVRYCYLTVLKIDRRGRTKVGIFNALIPFFQHCDTNNYKVAFNKETITSFINSLKKRYLDGLKGKTLIQIQGSLKSFLNEVDPNLNYELRNEFLSCLNDSDITLSYTDAELKQIVKLLYIIFNKYRYCVINGTKPSVHPLLCDDSGNDFLGNPFNGKHVFYVGRYSHTWKNELVKVALYLTCFYTGLNESQLLAIKFSDISNEPFERTSDGVYKLSTTKYRQQGKNNITTVGFSKRAKEFFETWLSLSKLITNNTSDYVFSVYSKQKYTRMLENQFTSVINKKLKYFELPALSTQRFRKTKATLIMRATESIFSVAEGLNNSPDTVSKHYSNGVPELMEFSIAGALDVRQRTLQGESLDEAVLESAYNFKDPVREKFYLKNKLAIPNTLSNGLRCKDSFGEKAKQLKISLVKAGLAMKKNKVACHKFLECFGCPHHAVIAEVDDIWLMLSFRDVILEVACQPSINSMPTTTLSKVTNTIESILDRLKQEFPHVYKSAEVKYSELPHPLWGDKTDFEFLMELN